SVSIEALLTAHHRLLARHPALGTTIVDDGRTVGQHTGTATEFPVTLATATAIDDELVRSTLDRQRLAGFDVLGGALARAELVATRTGEHLLVWSFHHAVVDGYSLGIIWDDFVALYNGAGLPEPV